MIKKEKQSTNSHSLSPSPHNNQGAYSSHSLNKEQAISNN